MTIPKVIHFIAPKDRTQWHPIWHRCYQSWIDKHPDFEIKLWNDKNDLYDLIQTYYPWYFSAFESFPYDIMRINFARFAMLHRFGGIYADMDVYCYNRIYDQLTNNDLYILQNYLNECIIEHIEYEMCLMISNSDHSYFSDCMQNSAEQFYNLRELFIRSQIDNEWLIEQICGGYLLFQTKDIHNPFQLTLLPYYSNNNRPSSYNKSFYTKHMRSSAWNRNFTPDKYLAVDGLLFSFSNNDSSIQSVIDKAKDLGLSYHIVDINDFDFYYDYSEGNYFCGDSSDKDLKQRIKQLYQYLVN